MLIHLLKVLVTQACKERGLSSVRYLGRRVNSKSLALLVHRERNQANTRSSQPRFESTTLVQIICGDRFRLFTCYSSAKSRYIGTSSA
jgi:cyanophycinase-like exopeptidase